MTLELLVDADYVVVFVNPDPHCLRGTAKRTTAPASACPLSSRAKGSDLGTPP